MAAPSAPVISTLTQLGALPGLGMIPSDLGSLPGGGGASSLPGLDSLPVDPSALLGTGYPVCPAYPVRIACQLVWLSA